MSNDDMLELQAARALEGASEALRRLSPLVDFHFEATAFSIKSRIKSQFSIVKKVTGRAEGYSCAQVRDIVGFRIIDLYRTTVPKTFKTFYSLVLLNGSNDLFHPSDEVEVTVYQPVVDDPPYREELSKVLEELDVRAKIERKKSNYSSIHLVANCHIEVRGVPKAVPIEFQFRSAIEDVWSEMEHKLKYKDVAEPGKEEDPTKRDFRAHLLERMAEQKTHFDALEKQAGTIFEAFGKLAQPLAPYTPARSEVIVANRVEDILAVAGLTKAQDARKRGLDLRAQAETIARLSAAALSPNQIAETAKLYEDSTSVFREVLKALGQPPVSISPSKKEFAVTITRMEIAFNAHSSGMFFRRIGLEPKAEAKFHDAAKIYGELYGNGVQIVMVPYRLAQIRFALGDFDGALHLLEEVDSRLDEDDDVKARKDHWLRSEMKRFWGLVMWNAAERMKGYAVQARRPDYKRDERIALYKAALTVTWNSLPLGVEPPAEAPDTVTRAAETAEHRRKALNNVLSYLSDLHLLGEDKRAMKDLGIGQVEILAFLDELGATKIEDILQLPSPERADSVIQTYTRLLTSTKRRTFNNEIAAASRAMVNRVAIDLGVPPPEGASLADWGESELQAILDQLENKDIDPRMNEMLTAAVAGLQRAGIIVAWRDRPE